MTYLKAVEAGVDVIDTAMSPFAMGTSQPATEVMVETFKGTPYDTGLDQNLLAEIADYFRPYRDECLANGLLNPKVMGVDIKTLLYQVPGGMLSNMVSQLKEQNAEDRYYDVLKEIPKVRKDLLVRRQSSTYCSVSVTRWLPRRPRQCCVVSMVRLLSP